MDYVTRQFINLAKKLRADLRQTLQKHTHAISQATEAARENKQYPLPVPLPVIAELQVPEADKTEQRDQHHQSHKLQIWLTLGTWLAFVAAAVYAGIAAFQLEQTKEAIHQATRAAKAAEDANTDAVTRFNKDQRPYVWLKTGYVGTAQFQADPKNPAVGKFAWSFRYTNYGKTPARRLYFSKEAYRFVVGGKFRSTPGFSKIKVYPTPLAPTEEDFVTIYSGEVTQQEFSHYASIDKAISIYAIMNYVDALGTPYESDICLSLQANGQVAFCEGNDIH